MYTIDLCICDNFQLSPRPYWSSQATEGYQITWQKSLILFSFKTLTFAMLELWTQVSNRNTSISNNSSINKLLVLRYYRSSFVLRLLNTKEKSKSHEHLLNCISYLWGNIINLSRLALYWIVFCICEEMSPSGHQNKAGNRTEKERGGESLNLFCLSEPPNQLVIPLQK